MSKTKPLLPTVPAYKNFELTGETIVFDGATLYRIRAVRDFGDIRAGTLGGWIENPKIIMGGLKDRVWVADEAKVYGNVQLFQDAVVSGKAVVKGGSKRTQPIMIVETALITDQARVSGSCFIRGNVRIGGHAQVSGDVTLAGHVQVKGNATVSGQIEIIHDEVIDGDMVIPFPNQNSALKAFDKSDQVVSALHQIKRHFDDAHHSFNTLPFQDRKRLLEMENAEALLGVPLLSGGKVVDQLLDNILGN